MGFFVGGGRGMLKFSDFFFFLGALGAGAGLGLTTVMPIVNDFFQ